MTEVNIIVAVGNYVPDKGFPIGKNGQIPWHNSADMKWFKETTTGHTVIMGRKTYESIGHPLKNRRNIVISSSLKSKDGVEVFPSLEDALTTVQPSEIVYIIGGATLYKYAIEHGLANRLLIDFIAEEVSDADAFFPDIVTDNSWEEEGAITTVENRKAYALSYVKCYGQNNHADEEYFKAVKKILKEGELKDTRSGKTKSLFGLQMRFNLKEGFPMLATKKIFSKGAIHELLWFLKGDTNIKYLVDNGVHIWDDDAYRHFLQNIQPKFLIQENISKEDFLKEVQNGSKHAIFGGKNGHGFEYTYGDLGNVYGKQWMDWNGINQIQNVINTLRTNPDDRRLLVSAWNVSEISSMALPPCHYSFQFYTKKMTLEERIVWAEEHGIKVHENIELLDEFKVPERKLSCLWNQRSCDFGLGIPFNIFSYALLTHMIAQCVNMDVDELIFNGGDCHVYENHIPYLEEQLKRNPHRYKLPNLVLNKNVRDIKDFIYSDIKIIDYESYPSIKMPLSVGL